MLLVISLGVGTGLGAGCARSYGILGFVFGFIAGGAGVMILMGITRAILPKRARPKTK